MSETSQTVGALFSRYLRRQMAAQAEGLGFADAEAQVVPHEAIPMQPVDPCVAWDHALAAVRCETANVARWEVPPDWPSLVAAQEPAIALPFCLGNFPQMVRDLQPFLSGAARLVPLTSRNRPLSVSTTLTQWANVQRSYPQCLLAVGVLRLARRFEEATALLSSNHETPVAWQALRANEEAALAWQRGNAEEALRLWQGQPARVPVLFNRGMASLFLDHPTEARSALREAVAQLPDTSAWHHLGHFYLALAEARI
jgi:tetratricopeptide (TPR) repeat protein